MVLGPLFTLIELDFANLGFAIFRGHLEQASELMGYVRDMTISGLMDEKPQLIWASHYLSALAKALLDDAELGMMR